MPIKRLLIAEQWHEFAKEVLPNDTPTRVRIAMRRAFYAGAAAFHFAMMNGISDGPDPLEEDMAMLKNAVEELVDFSDQMKAGRA